MPHRFPRFAVAAAAIALGALSSGCSVLIGNVKPVAEHADGYTVAELPKQDANWAPIEQDPGAPSDPQVSDYAYQSKRTASIISLTTNCRKRNVDEPKNLQELTNLLYMGVANITDRNEKNLTIRGTPALETTLRGNLNNQDMMFRTVVMRRDTCIFDFMYIARPKHFPEEEKTFGEFIASLNFK
ncbi:MAG: hypothetical protein AB7P04_15615 [Bacteriovoracia bacterium]